MKSALPYRREAYRLWFEYLRVARNSTLTRVREALKQTATFYAPWGDISNLKFNHWWKEKGYLFEDKYVVRRLTAREPPSNPESLIVEIPLSRSPTMLLKDVKTLIQEAFAKQAKEFKKSKKVPTSVYGLTEGAEPKLLAVREMLTVYRDVYLKNRELRGTDLLDKVHALYLGRRSKRWAKVPTPLLFDQKYGDNSVALRNLRRYITKAERVMLNVANGEFPGRY
jgi:hypothetical protein